MFVKIGFKDENYNIHVFVRRNWDFATKKEKKSQGKRIIPQTSVRLNNFNYLRFTSSNCKDIGLSNFKF